MNDMPENSAQAHLDALPDLRQPQEQPLAETSADNNLLIAASVEAAAAKFHEEEAVAQDVVAVTHDNLILAYHGRGELHAPDDANNQHEPISIHALPALNHSPPEPQMQPSLPAPSSNESNDSAKRKDAPPAAVEPAPKRQRATPTRVAWEDRLAMLKAYKDKHGDLLIPIRFKENPSLGKFVHNTREQYKLFHKLTPENYKKKCSLTAEKIQQLDDLGFVWTTERTKKQNQDWEARFQQLLEYKAEKGDCLVPHGYPQDTSFAEWIHRQRTTYATHLKEGRTNKMVEERMKKLEGIGFNFRVHLDKWDQHYQELVAYREQHGNTLVPTHYQQNPRLGRWVHTNRHQRRLLQKGRKSSMTLERIKLLDELGFSWEVRQSLPGPRHTWQQRATQLRDFHKEHGHFLVPPHSMPDLWQWCVEQKLRLINLHRHGTDATQTMKTKMNQDRVAILESIGFTKDVDLAPSLDGAPMMLPEEEDDEEISDDDAPDERTNMMAMEDMEMVGHDPHHHHDARNQSVGDPHDHDHDYPDDMETMDV